MLDFFKSKINKVKFAESPFLFIIGFNKSGTTSIHKLAQLSGYRSVHWDEGKLAKTILTNTLQGQPLLNGYEDKFQIFSDMAFRSKNFRFDANTLFMQLDHGYPNAKFLYNFRDIDAWLLSRLNHQEVVDGETNIEYYQRVLKTNDFDRIKQIWINERLRYGEDIRNYFSGTDKLLELDIKAQEFVDALNDFSGLKFINKCWEKHNIS
jgi:hypothetical protein